MASLIKNQIVKHLSKYAKNLNPDNISVDVLKGKGALHNVELNETLLTDILELPAWLSIKRAICNSVALKVPWTSLKTQPIILFMDEVKVDVVMSSDLRSTKSTSASLGLAYASTDYTGYGFVNKVIEGMTLNINSLEIFFSSEHFGGSLTLNQLQIASCTPYWKPNPVDLHQTRVKEPVLNEVLIFKLLTWQLLRVEASSLTDSIATAYNVNAPLRFITSQGRARITVKKSSVSGVMSAGRIQILLNDLLWVATLSQVRSAISFYQYILKLVQSATDLHKNMQPADIPSASKLPSVAQNSNFAFDNPPTRPMAAGTPQTPPQGSRPLSKNANFDKFDIVQSSYHFYADCIDLHICDEANAETVYPETWDFKSGALQITMTRLVCDFYPDYLVAGDRKYWVYYNESKSQVWMKQLLSHYFEKFSSDSTFTDTADDPCSIWSKMRSVCCLLRLYDLKVYCVSDASLSGQDKQHQSGKLQLFFGADREILQLPGEQPPLIMLEFNNYYLPGCYSNFLVPPCSTHIQVNPVRLYIDLRSIRWISFIYLNLCKTLGLDTSSVETVAHSDVRIEAIMPRVVIPLQNELTRFAFRSSDELDRVIFSTSSFCLTNLLVDLSDNLSAKNLLAYLESFQDFDLLRRTFDTNNERVKFNQIPTNSDALRLFLHDLKHLCNDFFQSTTVGETAKSVDVLGQSALNDVWMFEMNPLWIDFAGASISTTGKFTPLLVDTVFCGWSFLGNKLSQAVENADFYAFLKPASYLRFILDKYQYAFLMRLSEQAGTFLTLLNNDSKCFYQAMQAKSLVVGCLCPNVELNLVLHLPLEHHEFTAGADLYCGGRDSKLQESGNGLEQNAVKAPFEKDGHVIKYENSIHTSASTSTADTTSSSSFGPTTTIGSSVEGGVTDVKCFDNQNKVSANHVTITPIFEVNPLTSNVYQQTTQDDAYSIKTDTSDDDFLALDQCGDELCMFAEVFPSLAREKRTLLAAAAARQRPAPAVDLAEEALEVCLNDESGSSRSTTVSANRATNQKAYLVTCKLSQLQLLITCYDQESFVTLQSPKLDLVDGKEALPLQNIYSTCTSKETVNFAPFNGDVNDVKLLVRSVNDGRTPSARIQALLKETRLKLNDEYVQYLSDFIKPAARNDKYNSESVHSQATTGVFQMEINDFGIELTNNVADLSTFVHIVKAFVHQRISDDEHQTQQSCTTAANSGRTERERHVPSLVDYEKGASGAGRLEQLENENRRLKHLLNLAKLNLTIDPDRL